MNPMWVADMDFRCPGEITEALVKRAAHPAYGYTFQTQAATEAMLAFMQRRINAADFEVALIGAGAYGLPLAAYCRSLGKQAIQTSGATQILFGIKGRRWDDHPVISKLYNDAWVRPAPSETPKAQNVVEGGSYW